jgi:phage repressor protein C with HTH and peptisase S24 domain
MGREWIRNRLKALGKTQVQLARELDVDPPRVAEMIKGTRNVQAQEIRPMAACLEIDVPTLLRQLDNPGLALPEDAHIGNTSDFPPDSRHKYEPITGKNREFDSDSQAVVELSVRASAGGGTVVADEPELGVWSFPNLWLQTELRAASHDLRIITVEGDSMEGVLKSGDKVIVHVTRTQPSPPGLFILFDGIGLVAKRLEFLEGSEPPTVRISSSNPSYPPYERTLDEINIVGRIVGRWERL